MTQTDWATLLRFGLCHLRLSPETFWDLTPVELMLMSGADQGADFLDRATFDGLAQRFPDAADRNGQEG